MIQTIRTLETPEHECCCIEEVTLKDDDFLCTDKTCSNHDVSGSHIDSIEELRGCQQHHCLGYHLQHPYSGVE